LPHFKGEFDYSMDDRGRVPVPPRYRDAFAYGAVLAQGMPLKCLRLYTEESFNNLASLHTETPATQKAGLVARHALFPRAYDVEPDKQGRILIPQVLRSLAELQNNVVVLGNGQWIEIWAPENFAARMVEVGEEWQRAVEREESA
jgi:MraZ protein